LDEERQLLALVVNGYSSSEIAQKLAISYTSAAGRVHRLHKKLRRRAETS